jgi:hypothetical protein
MYTKGDEDKQTGQKQKETIGNWTVNTSSLVSVLCTYRIAR